jgi:hypothetical protein
MVLLHDLDELITECKNNEKRQTLIDVNKTYKFLDNAILYFIVIALVINAVVIMFSMESGQDGVCINSIQKVITNECYFVSSFALVMTAFRVWFFKFYSQQPVIGLWNQSLVNPLDKWLFGLFMLSAFACVGVFLVMIVKLLGSDYKRGIILASIQCGTCAFTSLMYKVHVSAYIKRAIDVETGTAPVTGNIINDYQNGVPYASVANA